MIDADIHGKLRPDGSNAHARSEDLMTSTVFGLLRHLPACDGIVALLDRVRPAFLEGENLDVQANASSGGRWLDLSAATDCDFRFWPRFGTYGQPDLLLTFMDRSGAAVHRVVVEVKLHSGKSGEADDEGQVVADPEWTNDQLARYWHGLATYLKEHQLDSVPHTVVYLTAHATPPIEDLAASLFAAPAMRLGWLCWHDVWYVVAPLAQAGVTAAAKDLVRLLEHRGFCEFRGFQHDAPPSPPSGGYWQPGVWFVGRAAPSAYTLGSFWRKQ